MLTILIQRLLTLTLLSPQCKEGGFPQELWLGVSADAVSVYKRGEGKPLEVFQYEHILSFGAPLANTYKIVVDERELLFETSEVRGGGGGAGRIHSISGEEENNASTWMLVTKSLHMNNSLQISCMGNSMVGPPSSKAKVGWLQICPVPPVEHIDPFLLQVGQERKRRKGYREKEHCWP